MKSLYDIRRIRQDRTTFSATETHAYTDGLIEEATEQIATYLYLNETEDVQSAGLYFIKREDATVDCVLQLFGVDKETSDNVACMITLSDFITTGIYDANRNKIFAKTIETLQAKGYDPHISTENEDEIIFDL